MMATETVQHFHKRLTIWRLRFIPILLAFSTPALANRDRLWVDELTTIKLVNRWNWWEILTVLPVYQPHLPAWFLIPELFGFPAAMALSFLSLGPTAWATVRLGNYLDGPATGVLAGLLVAVSPYLAVQASWLRMYGILTMLLTFGLYWGMAGRYWRAIAAIGLASIVHIFGAFGIPWLVYRSGWTRRLSPLQTGVLVGSGLPASLVVANKIFLHHGGQWSTASTGVGHGIQPGPLRILLTPAASLLGSPHNQIQVALAAVFTAILFWYCRDRHLLAWIAIPILSLALASYLLHPVFRLKYFGMVGPAVAVAVASVGGTRPRAVGGGIAGVLIAWGWLQADSLLIISRRFQFWFL